MVDSREHIQSLRNRVAVVVGGGSGLGRAIAKALARQGANVVIADFDEPRTQRTVGEILRLHTSEAAMALVTDVRNEGSVRSMTRNAIRAMGQIDILVNTAGVLLQGKLEKISIRDWNWMLDTNLMGAVRTSMTVLPHMLSRRSGHIINTVSLGGIAPTDPLATPYDSGHAALGTFTHGLALDTAGTGVHVSLYCPGSRGPRIGQNTRTRGLGRLLNANDGIDEGANSLDRFTVGLMDGLHNPRYFIVGDPHETAPELLGRVRAPEGATATR